MAQYASKIPEYALMSLNMPEHGSILLNIPEYAWKCLKKLFWLYQTNALSDCHLRYLTCFEYAWGIKYASGLSIPQYSYNNIIVTNVIILEFLSARFVHLDALQLTILYFFYKQELEHKTNES